MKKLFFEDRAMPLILEALGLSISSDNFIIDCNKSFVLDVDGNPIEPENLIGINKDKFFTSELQILN